MDESSLFFQSVICKKMLFSLSIPVSGRSCQKGCALNILMYSESFADSEGYPMVYIRLLLHTLRETKPYLGVHGL